MGRISMPQGRGSLRHNIRDYTQEEREKLSHINWSNTDQNIVFKHMDLKDAYEEIFGEYVREYNSKQKRNDRKIKNDDYLSKIKTSKNGEHTFYEDVLQWGTMDDFHLKAETRRKAKDALLKYIETFEERNPNLKLIGAYIHMDEASPHLHFDYIPVATGYKTGLPVRNSLSKAMEQMGYVVKEGASKKNNQTMLWKEHEREYFSSICEELGLTVEAEKSWGRNNLSVDEYKEAKIQIVRELYAEANIDIKMKYDEVNKEIAKFKKEAQTEIDDSLKENKRTCDQKLSDAETKAQSIINDANTKADDIKANATDEVNAVKEKLKWLDSRTETIKQYEESMRFLLNYLKIQLEKVKKIIVNISGVIFSSTKYVLKENSKHKEIIHTGYSIENTNNYPVIVKSDKHPFSYSLKPMETLDFLTSELDLRTIAAFRSNEVEVTRSGFEPEIIFNNDAASIVLSADGSTLTFSNKSNKVIKFHNDIVAKNLGISADDPILTLQPYDAFDYKDGKINNRKLADALYDSSSCIRETESITRNHNIERDDMDLTL